MTKVTLENFQAHEDTTLDLTEGFVAILGSTNSGKSSIVRAIRWLFYDSLRGKKFIREGQKSATVSVQFDDGTVSRTKSTTENSFSVNGTKMTAVGVGVPPEVINATKVHPVNLDGTSEIELNVAQQMSSPFLLMETDSFKAKALNLLTGANVFDAAIKETQKQIRDLESTKKSAEANIESIIEQLKSFADLDDQERRLKEVEALIVRYEQTIQKINSLNEAKQVLATSQAQVQTLKSELLTVDQWIPVFERAIYVEMQLNDLRLLDMLRMNRRGLESELAQTDSDLERFKSELLALPDVPCQTCGQLITKSARERMI